MLFLKRKLADAYWDWWKNRECMLFLKEGAVPLVVVVVVAVTLVGVWLLLEVGAAVMLVVAGLLHVEGVEGVRLEEGGLLVVVGEGVWSSRRGDSH